MCHLVLGVEYTEMNKVTNPALEEPSSGEDRQKITIMNKDKYSIDLCSTCHGNAEEEALEFIWD